LGRDSVSGTEGSRDVVVLRRLAIGRFSDAVVARVSGVDAPEVILKRVRARGKDHAAFEAAMTRAAAAYAQVSESDCSAIARLLESFPSEDRFVLVRERVDGLPLRRVSALLGTRLEMGVALYIGVRIFQALAAAHARGVVHGNLHPNNVLVSWGGHVQVSDFAVGHAARGLPHAASERADVYAASLIVCELLTGKAANEAKEVDLPLDVDPAAREALTFGLADVGQPSLGASLMARALRDAVNDERARALLVMALEAVRPPPESEPAREARSEATEEETEERTSTSVAAMYALVTPREAREAREAPRKAEKREVVACTREIVAHAREVSIRPKSPRILEPGVPSVAAAAKGDAAHADEDAAKVRPAQASTAAIVLDRVPPPPRPRGTRARAAIAGAFAMSALLAVGAFVARAPARVSEGAPRIAMTAVAPANGKAPGSSRASASASAPASASASAPASASASASTATLRISAAGRRVFLDGRLLGEGPLTLPIPCGPHSLRIGSSGPTRSIDAPCGATLALP